ALGDVQYLRAHLDPRGRHREGAQFEALRLLQILDNRDRFAAGRIVVKDVGDLFALEVAAELVLDKLYRRGALRPVGRGDWKQIRERLSVGRRGDGKAGRGAGDLVLFQLLVERLDLRRPIDQDRARTFPLLALVGLDRGRHLVLVVDLHVPDLEAFDPAL